MKLTITQQQKKIGAVIILAVLISGASTYFLWPRNGIKVSPPANMEERYRASFEAASAILAKDKNDYDSWLTVARVRAWSGDFTGALNVYGRMTKLKTDDIIPYFNMGDIYITLKDYVKAGEMYEKVIELNPKWTNAYREIFTLYRFGLNHKYDEKIEGMLKAGLLKSQDLGGPGVSDFYTMLGLYYRGRGEDAKAIENFKQALVIDPGNSGAKRELEEMKK